MGVARIILVRHGERQDFIDPEWKKTAKLVHDPPLSERGLQQAEETGSYLRAYCDESKDERSAALPVRTILASPFFRTLQTATNVAKAFPELDVTLQPAAAEWLQASCFDTPPPTHFYKIGTRDEPYPYIGAVDSKGLKEAFPRVVPAAAENIRVLPMYPEDEEFLLERAVRFYREELEPLLFAEGTAPSTVVVVSHGGPIEYMTRAILLESGLEYNVVPVTFCSVTEFIHDGSRATNGRRFWNMVQAASNTHLTYPEDLNAVHYYST
mmetsp:Transcript_14618/g.39122  ORF Transcript_14618/g.39122 Transcript_14618/m.39122 type:complete len:268 (-) Transcript_14618:695-1498(-)|eukprot:CAMPEP_0185833566 /NCGR_PEP_ID=MMETSP1353-20130828/3085_1 /TAXON_ID=1077150 /ORGANISM="Erythrolobus australicus, Strain CCMP3124" /LENGTH=267 /DNA_ID=CAMNT_0028531875 /DNA_START=35 /DNA_END=838 /DNA_ORIENTATION=-